MIMVKRSHALLLFLILTYSTLGNAGIISRNITLDLIEEIESYRSDLLDLPERLFDLEEKIDGIVNDSDLRRKLEELRGNTLALPGEFFSVELQVKRILKHMIKPNCKVWHLGMNLNPSDGHIMDYTTGWSTGEDIGSDKEALKKDYLDSQVWTKPADFIAIVRHQEGIVELVKVFRFQQVGLSLLQRFQQMNPGRITVSSGGPIQISVAENAENLSDDPIFSVGGDLAFNWVYDDNGNRVVLTGGYLAEAHVSDDATHGLGNHFACDCKVNSQDYPVWRHEISNIQSGTQIQQGTDHGAGSHFVSGPVYGNYAIYVSGDATSFPEPGFVLEREIKICI